MSKDPLCGMDVDSKNAIIKSDYKDQTYYFCCPDRKASIDKDPEKYSISHHEYGSQHH